MKYVPGDSGTSVQKLALKLHLIQLSKKLYIAYTPLLRYVVSQQIKLAIFYLRKRAIQENFMQAIVV